MRRENGKKPKACSACGLLTVSSSGSVVCDTALCSMMPEVRLQCRNASLDIATLKQNWANGYLTLKTFSTDVWVVSFGYIGNPAPGPLVYQG